MTARLLWLVGVPLVGAGLVGAIRDRCRSLVLALSLAALLACLALVSLLPVEQNVVFLGQRWLLDGAALGLVRFIYVVGATLLAVIAVGGIDEVLCGPLLTSVGLLSAVLLLDSVVVSLVLLPLALVVLALAVLPYSPSALRGASWFLAWVTLPVPLVLTALELLDRMPLLPEESSLESWSALLVALGFAMWLTLFPVDWTTRLWAKDGPGLVPAFLWTAKDAAVLMVLSDLWHRVPALRLEAGIGALGAVGTATAISSGLLAILQSTGGAVLACASMHALGIGLCGLTAGSVAGSLGGLALLVNRSVAVLLATSALAAFHYSDPGQREPNARPFDGRNLVFLVAFSLGILALAGLPLSLGSFGRGQVYATVPTKRWYLDLARLGIVLGLVRAVWAMRLWKVRLLSVRGLQPLILLVCCLLLVCMAVGHFPESTLDFVTNWVPPLVPATRL